MFDIGWSELVVVGLVALIVIGPKELPTVLRTAGQWMGKVKRMASEFQGQFQEALREAEVADLKNQADDLTGSFKSMTEFDPLADSEKESHSEAASDEWDDTFETPERDEPAAETVAETEPVSGESEPAPAPVTRVESAPVEDLPDVGPPAEPAATPPPKQARGSA